MAKKEIYKLDVPNFNHNFFFIYVTIVMTGVKHLFFLSELAANKPKVSQVPCIPHLWK